MKWNTNWLWKHLRLVKLTSTVNDADGISLSINFDVTSEDSGINDELVKLDFSKKIIKKVKQFVNHRNLDPDWVALFSFHIAPPLFHVMAYSDFFNSMILRIILIFIMKWSKNWLWKHLRVVKFTSTVNDADGISWSIDVDNTCEDSGINDELVELGFSKEIETKFVD